MSRPRLVNLLDDFALGGVSRGLGVFDAAAVRAVVDPSVVAFKPDAVIAPRCDADVIVTHFPPNWRRIAAQRTEPKSATRRLIPTSPVAADGPESPQGWRCAHKRRP